MEDLTLHFRMDILEAMKTLKYFLSYYRPYRGMFFMDLFCASVISLVDIAYPLIFNFCVTGLLPHPSPDLMRNVVLISLGLIVLYVIRSACRWYVTGQGHIMGARMESDMRQDLFDKFQQLSFSWFDNHNTGDLMSRMVSDLFDISELAHHGPENLFISLIKIIGSFAIMMAINWKLGLVLLAITLIMLVFSWFQNSKMEETFADNRKKIAGVNSSLQDSLGGIRVVQSFANEDLEARKFNASNQAFLRSKERNYHAMAAYYTGNHFFQGMLYAAILLAGGLLSIRGEIEPAVLATFALYVNVFVSPLEILIEFTEMFQKGFSGFRRFESIMDEAIEIQDEPGASELNDVNGDVELDQVSFSYDDDGQGVLEDVSLKIPAGQSLALVGPSGGGKSTLCSLIPRFYDPDKGAIRIDGKDVRNLTLKSLRKNIGIVQQDVYLFDGTIAENIRYGKPDATDEEVLEACRKANLLDFIEELPEGIYTEIGERGTRLSGGQKQRISIARIFLKDPKILILDEATSALDNESERIVQKSLDELSKGRTCISIAHRLSTIQNADEIAVVSGNGIQEKGTHEELMRLDGLYANYYRLQFRNSSDPNSKTV